MKLIDFRFKPGDSNLMKMAKVFAIIGRGTIDEYIDFEDLDLEDIEIEQTADNKKTE